MDRKRAIGLASSISIATAGAVVALGANFGLFGLAASASAPPLPVSVTEPAAVRQDVANVPSEQQLIEETRVIDVPVHVPSAVPGAAAATAPEAEDDDSLESVESSDDHGAPEVTSTPSSHDDDSADVEERDDDRAQPCETHDDGKVECHDEDD